ncbi:TonB-dependent receptor [Altererythrobacter sp. BO-6]|uniref:TonB-dependent receptor n=1 Tax=Altererythrobacter sp. BO-6 TaxID=2604537 RepID=UPI0013E137F1|nr:TonB-dependent receptor [Altererythrobacter sp. BO-6]QIG53367.1 TonB-dependent receptor [Altererythrobacter sp. BO-6]
MKHFLALGTAFSALAILLPTTAFAQATDETAVETVQLDSVQGETILVTATRSGTELENLPVSVSVVTEEELQEQLRQNRSILSALEFTVPGLSIQQPESRSSCGSQIRGRNASFQINGVPVNEDLRQGSCTAPFAITPFSIERVEVVRGGTALYGAGAPGGIINLITRRASSRDLEIDITAQTSFNTEVSSGTFTTDLFVGAGQDLGAFDYYIGGGYTDGGLSRSANGLPVQSSAFEAIDLVGSAGIEIGVATLRFTGTYHDEDKGAEFYPDGTFLPGSEEVVKVVEVDGHPQLNEATDRSATAALSFNHPELLAHDVTLSLFYQQQEIIQRDNFFSDEFGNDLFASNRENSRFGVRSTLVRSYDIGASKLKTSYGADYTSNDFYRFIVDPAGEDTVTGYITPAFYLVTLAPFAQAEFTAGSFTLTGGVRHEWYSGAIEEDGFDPSLPRAATPGNFADSELTLWNLGAIFQFNDVMQVYTSFSQGAELSQLSRAARGASDPGAISNEPATSDQYELGLRGDTGPLTFGLAAYYSESDSSSQIQPDPTCAGQTFCPLIPLRIPERTWGLEAQAQWTALDNLQLTGVFTLQRGEVFDDAASEWINFSTDRAVPLRITVRADWQPIEALDLGFQVNHYGASSYFTPTQESIGLAESDAVTLASANISYELGPITVYATADNLFDEVYVNPAAQADGFDFFNYEAPGRRVTLGVRGRF